MNRRPVVTFLALVACTVLALAGCETLQQRKLTSDHDPELKHASGDAAPTEGDKVLDVQSDVKKSKPFFRSSRLSSGLSSEAREIEGDLGVH
jgi:hypothetical protein